jgi:hypothetical protein
MPRSGPEAGFPPLQSWFILTELCNQTPGICDPQKITIYLIVKPSNSQNSPKLKRI